MVNELRYQIARARFKAILWWLIYTGRGHQGCSPDSPAERLQCGGWPSSELRRDKTRPPASGRESFLYFIFI